jgi:GT2 family glycosyltransferase
VKVGVAIPVRDQQRYIETLLTTVMAQTVPCAAYIVDDASTDGLRDFLLARPSWWRAYETNQSRQGWPATLNTAAGLAIDDGCDAFMVMNADDFLRVDAIERLTRALQHADAAVPYCQQLGGQDIVQASADHVTLESFVDHTPLVAHTLVRSSVWRSLGGYDLDVNLPGLLAGYNEWDFWARFHTAGHLHVTVQEPLVYYRMHPGQLHRATTARHAEAVALVHAKHPRLAAIAEERARQDHD